MIGIALLAKEKSVVRVRVVVALYACGDGMREENIYTSYLSASLLSHRFRVTIIFDAVRRSRKAASECVHAVGGPQKPPSALTYISRK